MLIPWLKERLLENVPATGILLRLKRDFEIDISKSTLQRFLSLNDLHRTVDIPNQQLKEFIQQDQDSQGRQVGYKMLVARIRSVFGIPVKQKPVMDIMKELYPEEVKRRQTRKFIRRYVNRADNIAVK
jgi:hypothetical protein